MLGTIIPSDVPELIELDFEELDAPEEWDWRKVDGVLNPVKNQGSCGSCWAFASNAVHESTWAIKTGTLYDLAEQHLVDCADTGCNGGWYVTAWRYVEKFGGLNQQKDYPYFAETQSCVPDKEKNVAPIKGSSYVSAFEMKAKIAERPVAVAVDATNWHFY